MIDLLGTQHLPPGLVVERVQPCCELVESAQAGESMKTLLNGQNPHEEDHWWLDLKVIENLPLSFKRGKEDEQVTVYKPKRGFSYLLFGKVTKSFLHATVSN